MTLEQLDIPQSPLCKMMERMAMKMDGNIWFGRLGAIVALSAVFSGVLCAAPASAQKPFKVEATWKIGGDGSWDYLTVDPTAHRLYIAHQTKVDVVDLNTGKEIGSVIGLMRCHGVVISPDGKTGFVSDGGANAVVAFDLNTFEQNDKIAAGTNPDGMAYEPTTNTLWAFNGGSKNATIINMASHKVVGTVPLPGKPEFPVVDGAGTIFVNIEDANSVVRIDAKSQKATATWKLTGCESPSGQAIDVAGSRLFAVCDGKKMAVTDAKTGKSLATTAIGDEPDATAYDPKSGLAFSSNGDGTLTVVDTKDGYKVIQTLPTMEGARTMQLDPSTGKVYLVSATLKKVPGAKRPSAMPNSFTVLVVGRD
jgi:DNA-binding beta-propeller fold protein YncE